MIPRLGIVTGAGAFARWLAEADGDAVLFSFDGMPSAMAPGETIVCRFDRLSAFLAALHDNAVSELVFAGRVLPPVDWLPQPGDSYSALSARIADPDGDPKSRAFLKTLVDDVAKGTDAVMRRFIAFLEAEGVTVAHPVEAAPAIFVPARTRTDLAPTGRQREAAITALGALSALSDMGVATAAVSAGGRVLAIETETGLDAMLDGLAATDRALRPPGAVLAVAPFVGQDPRFNLPVLTPDTVARAARAGVEAIVVASGGVAVLDPERVLAACAEAGIAFLAQ